MSDYLKKYTDLKQIRVGDVVQPTAGADIYPFATHIVTGLELDNEFPKVFLSRPHARVAAMSPLGHHDDEGILVPCCETYSVSADKFLSTFSVFVEGPGNKVDNRNFLHRDWLVKNRDTASETLSDRNEAPLSRISTVSKLNEFCHRVAKNESGMHSSYPLEKRLAFDFSFELEDAFTRKELVQLCKLHGKKTSGKKEELAKRLIPAAVKNAMSKIKTSDKGE